ncbi:MAG: glycoside hydrolase family 3 C-terminal domain-containing protein [Parabacteroides sp.]|nr:glycoside hydrolase family 3 C-terminal domain-containing protein [Parabacteroides sp.]
MRMLWDTPKPDLTAEAIQAARSSDAVILCMGLSPLLEGEEMKVQVPGFDKGDRMDIQLPSVQTELIKEIYRLGKPTVLVLLNGSALAFNWEAEHLPAIVEAWYPGQAGGTAIADVLFGDYNPSGRLPVTFYKSIDQIPAFENYDMQGKTYRYFTGEPLYGFGYGLSYSTFEYSWASAPDSIQAGDSLNISVNVKNSSRRAGDEVVQVYVSLHNTSLKVPVRSLQGFKRVHLKAGESRTVSFTLTPKQLSGRDEYTIQTVAPGQLHLSIGGRQPAGNPEDGNRFVRKNIKIQGDPYYIVE